MQDLLIGFFIGCGFSVFLGGVIMSACIVGSSKDDYDDDEWDR